MNARTRFPHVYKRSILMLSINTIALLVITIMTRGSNGTHTIAAFMCAANIAFLMFRVLGHFIDPTTRAPKIPIKRKPNHNS